MLGIVWTPFHPPNYRLKMTILMSGFSQFGVASCLISLTSLSVYYRTIDLKTMRGCGITFGDNADTG